MCVSWVNRQHHLLIWSPMTHHTVVTEPTFSFLKCKLLPKSTYERTEPTLYSNLRAWHHKCSFVLWWLYLCHQATLVAFHTWLWLNRHFPSCFHNVHFFGQPKVHALVHLAGGVFTGVIPKFHPESPPGTWRNIVCNQCQKALSREGEGSNKWSPSTKAFSPRYLSLAALFPVLVLLVTLELVHK